MAGYIEGVGRGQVTLFPDRLDDFVDADNPVRVIDVFVDALDLRELDFARALPTTMGRPGYHPAVLLKLYTYGYLNRIASSRRLEREAGRNVELMWLTGRLAPDHRTIADFRRDNGPAIRKVCSRFVLLCRKMGLLGEGVVAIDGSKFKAVNNRDRNFTPAKMVRRLAEIEAAIGRYMAEMDGADVAEPGGQARVEHLAQKLAVLHAYMVELKAVDERLRASPDGQVSLTDPDARSMNARGSGIVGYNVQAAVEARHHLVVASGTLGDELITGFRVGGRSGSRAPTGSSHERAPLRTERLRVVHYSAAPAQQAARRAACGRPQGAERHLLADQNRLALG